MFKTLTTTSKKIKNPNKSYLFSDNENSDLNNSNFNNSFSMVKKERYVELKMLLGCVPKSIIFQLYF